MKWAVYSEDGLYEDAGPFDSYYSAVACADELNFENGTDRAWTDETYWVEEYEGIRE